MKFISIILYTVLALALSMQADGQRRTNIAGEWKVRLLNSADAIPANVPGIIHADLQKANRIPNPFAGCNENELQWIGDSSWVYSTTFTVITDLLASRHVELVFDGIDTYAEILLNGSMLGKTSNMFRQYRYDILPLLHTGENNLEVRMLPLSAADTVGKKLAPGGEWAMYRKSAYHFGWDWGPRFVTAGIWKPAYIESWNSVVIRDMHVTTSAIETSRATLAATLTLESAAKCHADISIMLDSALTVRQKVQLSKGVNRVAFPINVENPRLWYPNGQGEAHLYSIVAIAENGKERAEQKLRYGIRSIELIQEPDNAGCSFYFKVNGQPTFMKGANIIPRHSFLPQAQNSSLRQLLTDAAGAGMNMLRVWGGGAYEDNLFYDLCDSLGILAWQDFMFAGSMYPADSLFIDNVSEEAVQQVKRLRNHACLALWCGNNEVSEAWYNWGWQRQFKISKEDSAAIWRGYLLLFEKVLPDVVATYDTERAYWPSSPQYGWGRARSMTHGDSHYWGVWWGRQPFEVYTQKIPRFMSEYGFQGFPTIEAVRKFSATGNTLPDSLELRCHQKHPVGFEIINEYLDREGLHPKTLTEMVYHSQLVQAKGMRMAMEAHRRAKPYCMGSLFWQLNDCWPVVSWSAIDALGHRKAVYYAAKDAFADVLLSPVVSERGITLSVVSDRLQPVHGELVATAMGFDGSPIAEEKQQVDVGVNATVSLSFPQIDSVLQQIDRTKHLVVFRLKTGADSYRSVAYMVRLGDLQLPKAKPQVVVVEKDSQKYLSISTDVLVKNLYIRFEGVEATLSDNFMDILPVETQLLKIESDASIDVLQQAIRLQSLSL